jgi:hypothetical protein
MLARPAAQLRDTNRNVKDCGERQRVAALLITRLKMHLDDLFSSLDHFLTIQSKKEGHSIE